MGSVGRFLRCSLLCNLVAALMDFTPDEPEEALDGVFDDDGVEWDQAYGHDLYPLPEGYVADGVFVIAKCYQDNEGVPVLCFRADGLATWEVVGMLKSALADAENQFVDSMEHAWPDEEEEEDED